MVPSATVTVSNTGPRSLDYWVNWLECRARADFTLLVTNDGPFGWVPLPSGATTNLTWDLVRNPSPGEAPLLCCQIEWFESEPKLWRLGRKLEPRLSQAMDLLNPQWLPPWDSQSKPRARGTVFASNVEVAEYFRLVHGFTRSAWLEELARYEEAKAQQVTQGQYFVQRYGYADAPNAEESMKFRAKSAFVSYCQRTTNGWKRTELETQRDAASTNR